MKLSKCGYGDIVTIKNLDVKTFMNLVHYQNYIDDYQMEFDLLNARK